LDPVHVYSSSSKALRAALVGLLFVLGSCSISLPGQNLVFDDEFNGTHVDVSKWNVVNGPSWDQPTWFLPQSVQVHNGTLEITTERRSINGYHYTTGMVNSLGTFSFLYGRVDIRAMLPKGQGIWPGLWLLTSSASHETDMMELLGNDSHTVYMTVHYGSSGQYIGGQYTGPDFSADYHIFSVVWEPGRVTWYIDGVERFETTQHVSNQPMYLLLDTWVGTASSWPGAPDGTTVFPQHLSIDYVRVYQGS
jgi:beta-glucanase (GH16 family)